MNWSRSNSPNADAPCCPADIARPGAPVPLRPPRRASCRSYHFVGIGGSGMSGLARMLARRGHRVTGSDMAHSPVLDRLGADAITVTVGHAPGNIPPRTDCLVVSAAVKPDNPEWRWALAHGLPVRKYAQLLGDLSADVPTWAVSGTHGKSTTTGWLAYVLRSAGFDPSFVVGADVPQLDGASGAGRDHLLVVEACEYDRSFLNLHPHAAAVLNIEADHLDYYRDLDEIITAFAAFARCLAPAGLVVAPAADPSVRAALAGHPARSALFALQCRGPARHADWWTRRLEWDHGRARFDLIWHGRNLGRVALELAGEHNVLNALAVAALAHEAGAPAPAICHALSTFLGARRRMTCKGSPGGVLILDDYAHHPTEIRFTLHALRARYAPRRLWCVFQPHQHSRTRFLLDDFALSFHAADVVLLPDIYFVRDSEALRREINAAQLAQRITAHGGEAHYLADFALILDYLTAAVQPGDLVVTMGAGDIWKLADELVCRFGTDR